MSAQQVLAWATGVIFLLLLVIIGFVIYWRGTANPVPKEAMLIFRIAISVAGAGVAAVFPGFIEIESKGASAGLRAGGALAAFVILYFFNPPAIVEKTLAKPGKPEKREVAGDRIEPDL